MDSPCYNPYLRVQEHITSTDEEQTVAVIAQQTGVDPTVVEHFLDYLHSVGEVVRTDSTPHRYYPNTFQFFVRDVCERVIQQSSGELESRVFDDGRMPPEHTLNFARTLFESAVDDSGTPYTETVEGATEKFFKAREQLIDEWALALHYRFEMQGQTPAAAHA